MNTSIRKKHKLAKMDALFMLSKDGTSEMVVFREG